MDKNLPQVPAIIVIIIIDAHSNKFYNVIDKLNISVR